MTLKWKAFGEGPHPLSGNTDNEWFKQQTIRPESQTVIDNPDPSVGPPKLFRFEVKFGDNFPNMSDCRSLISPPAHCWVSPTDPPTEEWWRWIHRVPVDFVPIYPKWDQLYGWPDPGQSASAGTGLEWHHEPFGGGQENGSAPIYTLSALLGLLMSLVKKPPNNTSAYQGFTLDAPLKYGHNYDIVCHFLWSPDPAKGLIECWVDGVKVVSFKTFTMYDNCRSYHVAGIYRNFNIGGHVDEKGNPLIWPADATPGVNYPYGFVPKKGELVFPKDDGYPGSQMLGGFACGDVLADVLNLYPGPNNSIGGSTVPIDPVPAPVPAPTPAPAPVPTPTPAPAGVDPLKQPVDPAHADAWRLALVGQVYPPATATLPLLLGKIDAETAAVAATRAAHAADFDTLSTTLTAMRADALARLDAQSAALASIRSDVDAARAAVAAILDKGQ